MIPAKASTVTGTVKLVESLWSLHVTVSSPGTPSASAESEQRLTGDWMVIWNALKQLNVPSGSVSIHCVFPFDARVHVVGVHPATVQDPVAA